MPSSPASPPDHPLFRPAGAAAEGDDPVAIRPEQAGWSFAGLRVMRLAPGQARTLDTSEDEMIVLPLSGACMVACDGRRFELEGRRSVFARVSDFAYVPRDARVTIESAAGGEFALPTARARRRLEPAYGPADRVPVE